MHKVKLFDNRGLTVRPYEGNESEQISAVQHFQVATFMRALLFFHLHFALGLGRQYAIKILPFFFFQHSQI